MCLALSAPVARPVPFPITPDRSDDGDPRFDAELDAWAAERCAASVEYQIDAEGGAL